MISIDEALQVFGGRRMNTGILEPCPFCGGEAEIQTVVSKFWNGKKFYYVICLDCEATKGYTEEAGAFYLSREEAVREWNRRYPNET